MKSHQSNSGIVILIHDPDIRKMATTVLSPIANLHIASTPRETESILKREACGVIVVEDELPDEAGIMFFARINHLYPSLRRILISGPLDPELTFIIINEANVFRCIPKPVDENTLRSMVKAALVSHRETHDLLSNTVSPEMSSSSKAHLFNPSWAHLPRFLFVTTLALGWILLIGTMALVILYLIKSLLGIDLIEGAHLSDLFN